MNQKSGRKPVSTALLLSVALPIFGFLHVYPWIPGQETPIVLGVIPMPLFLWILWTVLLLAFVVYIIVVRDPYAYVAHRLEQARDSELPDEGAS